MRQMDPKRQAAENAGFQAHRLGQEIRLARTRNGQTLRDVARAAGVSRSTVRRVETGETGIGWRNMNAVAAAVGLDVALRAYPSRGRQLRDTGQMRLAEALRNLAHPSWKVAIEHPIAGGRSADEVFFGPEEIIHLEIVRLADWQGQYRPAVAKRDELQSAHARPVRLVLAFEDTAHNRRVLAEHATLIRHALPASSRKVMQSLREGTPLGEDGLLWVRPRRPIFRPNSA
ncbi:MAG TPA: helix-turn-helix transcriptional regulator [Candidatus Limnocylindria bacterium]|nr:helix-turn-helix transcriptional regulator [Candidatus Limnocylindria bacterium]